MATKCTALFTLTTEPVAGGRSPRTAGWSESIYATSEVAATVQEYFVRWCNARAGLLTKGAAIVGQRYQLVDPVRGSAPGTRVFQGAAGPTGTSADPTQDYPALAAYFRVPVQGIVNRSRPFTLRGLPDAFVRGGEWYGGGLGAGITTGNTALNTFLELLDGWQHRYRAPSVAGTPIFSATALGTVVFDTPHTYVVNDVLEAYRVVDTEGNTIQGEFMVLTVPTSHSVTLAGWPADTVVSQRGQLRKVSFAYATFQEVPGTIIPRIISRKPGRPFDSFRGRASRRRT